MSSILYMATTHMTVLEGDMDIDGSLAKTVLIVVRFN